MILYTEYTELFLANLICSSVTKALSFKKND